MTLWTSSPKGVFATEQSSGVSLWPGTLFKVYHNQANCIQTDEWDFLAAAGPLPKMKGAKYPIPWREFPQLECDMCTPRITRHWHKDSWLLQLSPAHMRRGQGWWHGQSEGHSERTALPWRGRCCSPSLSNHSGSAHIMIQGVPVRRGGCCWSALCLLQWGNGRGDEFGRGGREGQRCSLHSYHLVLQGCMGLQQVKWTLLKMAGLEPPGWYLAPLYLPPLPHHQKAAWQGL